MIRKPIPYPSYRFSGPSWVGDIPVHWSVLPNRALFVEVDDKEHPNEQMLSVTIADGIVKQNVLLEDSPKKDTSKLDKSAYKLVTPGDIAYNKMRAWQGAIGMSNHRGIVSPAYVVQRPRGEIVSQYFHHLLRTPEFAAEAQRWSYGIASDMWSLRPEHFKMIYCCLPPLDEQIAIVQYIDYINMHIYEYISAQKRLISVLREERQTILNEAVTRGLDPSVQFKPSGVEWLGNVPEYWEVRRLSTIARLRVSNVDKHSKEGEAPVRLCNYVDVYKNGYITSTMSFMTATASMDEIERFRLNKDDVLITKDSESWQDIGVPAWVAESADDLLSGYHLAILRPNKEILGPYLALACETKAIAHQFSVRANGVTRYGLARSDIGSVRIPLPPILEQRAIVSYIAEATSKIDAAITRARRQIELLQEYRTRLIADVVTGKLDVRDAVAQLSEDDDEVGLIDDDLAREDLNPVVHDVDLPGIV